MSGREPWFSTTGALLYREFVEAIDACAKSAPVVSTHNEPQPSPQEWGCGCITACYVTDRDFLNDERPFEMRVARACLTAECETLPLIREAASSQERSS